MSGVLEKTILRNLERIEERSMREIEFIKAWCDAGNTVADISQRFGLSEIGCLSRAERLRQRGIPLAARRR